MAARAPRWRSEPDLNHFDHADLSNYLSVKEAVVGGPDSFLAEAGTQLEKTNAKFTTINRITRHVTAPRRRPRRLRNAPRPRPRPVPATSPRASPARCRRRALDQHSSSPRPRRAGRARRRVVKVATSTKSGSPPTCVEIKILRRVRAESSRRPPSHRRDACSMAWRCRFLAARPSQVGRVVAEK